MVVKANKRRATKPELTNEIASIERSLLEALFFGGGVKLLTNGDETLKTRGGGKGLLIYDDLERDCHAGSVLDKRKRAVTAREWFLEPASDDAGDVEVANAVKQILENLQFDKLTKDLLDATLKGFSVVELMWEVREKRLVPAVFIARDQRRFTFDTDRRLRMLTREKPFDGEEMPDRKFIVHTYGGKDGSPFGRGLGSKLFWPVFFKRKNITFWLIFNEKFGSPTATGTYPSGSTPGDQAKLLEALQAISQEAGVIVPEGMEIKLLEAARAGAGDGYERLCVYMDSEISKAVLGETLTTTVGNTGGNRALGDVHQEVRMELAKDDADDLSYTLNETLIKWIVELNFPGRTPPQIWRNFEEPADLDAAAARDTKLKQLGWERDDQSFQDTYGAGYTRVKGASPPAVEFAEGTAGEQRARNRADQDAIAEGSVQLAEEWERMLGGRVQEIRTLLDETGDLTLVRQRLTELLDQEPSAEFIEQLTRATFASHLMGRVKRTPAEVELAEARGPNVSVHLPESITHALDVTGMQELAAEMRNTAAQVARTNQDVQRAADSVVDASERMGKGLAEIAKTIAQPVVPVYSSTGKLVGAQRVQKIDK